MGCLLHCDVLQIEDIRMFLMEAEDVACIVVEWAPNIQRDVLPVTSI